MELHIYKTEKAPSGRTVKLDEIECTYNVKDYISPSSELIVNVMNLFPTSEINKIVNTLLGIATLMSKTGSLKIDKEQADFKFNLEVFFSDENSKYSKLVMEAFLGLLKDNFDRAIDASQLILEQHRIYLTREQVASIEPQELAKVFLSLFRFLLYISNTVK